MFKQKFTQAVIAVVVLMTMAVPAAAQKDKDKNNKSKWIKLSTPHFDLYTDAGDRKGRDALKRFDQLRQTLQFFPKSENGPQLPVQIFLIDKDADYRKFRPATAGIAYYQPGDDRDYIVMRGTGGETYTTAFHEYTHLVLNRSSVRIPRWLEEGTAEYYSSVSPDGRRIRVGKAISVHQKALNNQTTWLKPEQLLAVRGDNAAFNESSRSGIVYAQSWAFVHSLFAADRYKQAIPRYAELLVDGTSYGPAFMDAFAKPSEVFWKELMLYAKTKKYPNLRLDAAVDAIATVKPEKLELAQINVELAGLLHVIGRTKEAEVLYKQLAEESETPAISVALGALALDRKDYQAAREYLEKVVESGDNARAHFVYAQLLRAANGDKNKVLEHLKKTAELSPNFAQAHYELGTTAAAERHYAEAAEHLQRAANAFPKMATYWHSLSLAHHQLKQSEQARRAAYKALFASTNAQESSMVLATLDMVDGRQVQLAEKKADVSAGGFINERKGEAALEGTLVRVDCIGQAARFHVLAGEKRVLLYSLKPQEITLKNFTSETREFVCGPQKALTVKVEYNNKPDAGLRSSGDVVSIELKAN